MTRKSIIPDQIIFTQMIGLLIGYAVLLGYGLTFADAYAKSGHREGSFHYKRLAVDFNLFFWDIDKQKWIYQRSTEAHEKLGIFWESIGGTWGGRFRRKDGNHYSKGESR